MQPAFRQLNARLASICHRICKVPTQRKQNFGDRHMTKQVTMIRLQLPYNHLRIHHCTVVMPAYVMVQKLATFIIICSCRITIGSGYNYVNRPELLEQGQCCTKYLINMFINCQLASYHENFVLENIYGSVKSYVLMHRTRLVVIFNSCKTIDDVDSCRGVIISISCMCVCVCVLNYTDCLWAIQDHFTYQVHVHILIVCLCL